MELEYPIIYLAGKAGKSQDHLQNEGGLLFGIICGLTDRNDLNMNSTQDMLAVLEAVSRITEVPQGKIFSRQRGQEYLDARWMAVQLLNDMGYYSCRISQLSGMTTRNVNLILTGIKQKQNSTWLMFRKNLEECRKVLGISREITITDGV